MGWLEFSRWMGLDRRLSLSASLLRAPYGAKNQNQNILAMPGKPLRHARWLACWRGAWGNRGMEKSTQKIHIQQQSCSKTDKKSKSKHTGHAWVATEACRLAGWHGWHGGIRAWNKQSIYFSKICCCLMF